MRRLVTVTFLALATAAAPGLVLAEVGKDRTRGGAVAFASTSATSPTPSASASEAGAPAHHETADQKKRRQDYSRAVATKIKAVAQKKRMTPEMKALVQKHWRIALRLLRVQRIAEDAGSTSVAKRAADALVKEDARFYAKLDELGKAAPAASASAAPSGSAAAAPKPSGGGK